MADTTTAAVQIKRYCKQTGQMCELATDFGYCQLTSCTKQKHGVDMREVDDLVEVQDKCGGDSCPIHFPDEPKYDPDEFFSAERSGKW